ncbi:MAG TPA: serine hydrolase domain-containing protein [Steroidobacteraceae bacterium]|nr:serine hydrolase domain-containing protein [Steroidobacteraceae bacterium]
MIRLRLVLCLLVVSTASAADLLPGATKKLDAYFDLLQQQGLVNGSIAISERGAVRFSRPLGFASIENGRPQPADEGTRYRIGAVSRLFTAALTMQLAESATITLDNTLAEFYPDLPNATHITYRQLLQDRSGLSDYAASPTLADARATPRSHADLLKLIETGGTRFPPGERVDVVDTNYLLLGYVLEKVREKSYDEILRRQVAAKLGIARTYYAGSGLASSLEARSYRWNDGWQAVPDDDASLSGGAGALLSNAGDLVTFTDAMFAGRIVTPYSLGNMREQGIGLRSLDIAGASCLGARGRTAAFDTFVCHFPDRRLTIAWTGNGTRVPVDQLLDETLRLVFEKGRKPPKTVAPE